MPSESPPGAREEGLIASFGTLLDPEDMRLAQSVLKVWLWVVLASSSSVASSPALVAQTTCLNTLDCCIQRWPLSAAEHCGASAADIARVLNGVRVLHDATQSVGVTFKEEAHEHENAEADEASGDSDEPADCKGQNHHIISRPIAAELERHRTLRGLYEPRDKRFVARAKDKESHRGYQKWHRDVDEEVVRWLKRETTATPKRFEKFLREIYNRPEMLKRFPNGF